MPQGRNYPCNPQLNAILENYFTPEGASIKSISAITARGGTSPTTLTRSDMSAEVAKLASGLTPEEWREVGLYYTWRAIGDIATRKATAARQEARNRGKRRKVKTGLAEIERKWNERKKKRG